MHTGSHGRFYFPPGPKRSRVRRRSRTAAASVCGLDVNQSMSQPTKYIPLTVHKAPELTKLQAASYVGVRYTWPLELARGTELRWKKSSLLLKLKACAGQRVYPLRTPRLEDTVLDAHTREPITVTTERYLFYASVDCLSLGTVKSWYNSFLKSAWRDHTRCSVQIVTKST